MLIPQSASAPRESAASADPFLQACLDFQRLERSRYARKHANGDYVQSHGETIDAKQGALLDVICNESDYGQSDRRAARARCIEIETKHDLGGDIGSVGRRLLLAMIRDAKAC
jgi:hypothetical protein